MYERFDVKVRNSASFDPWSNRACKRHNQTLTIILLKAKDNTKCDYDTAPAWAECAKNALINSNRFTNLTN